MRKQKLTMPFLMMLLILCSCQKEALHQAANSPVENGMVDVYVAGYLLSDSTYETHPVYWKNGQVTPLSDGTNYAVANSIAVSGDDVYVAGYRVQWTPRNIVTVGMLWKSDSAREVGAGGGVQLASLVIENNDVYYVEEENLWPGAVAKYWKNDSLVQLTDNSLGASAESIAVSGNNVYVAGTGREGSDADPVGIAKYWKNGIPNNLTDGSTSAYASSIAISGNDVYVLGVQYDGAPDGQGYRYGVIKFWKNGTVVRVTDGSADATGAAIAVSGNDVYIAGTEYDGIIVNGFHRGVAKYWKNGVPVVLTDGSAHAVAESIAVNGSDVYVAGTTNLDPISFLSGIPTYWKNGIPVQLADTATRGAAKSIFIVNR